MVIKIPSKHIYQKENAKVIDNQIGKIGLTPKTPSLINDTQNVYNESIEDGFVQQQRQSNTIYDGSRFGGSWDWAISWVQITPTYIIKTFTIPKKYANTSILRILTGLESNDQTHIKCSFMGTRTKGYANAQGFVTFQGVVPTGVSNSIVAVDIPNSNIGRVATTVDEGVRYSFTNDDLTLTDTVDNYDLATAYSQRKTATASITLYSSDNVASATVKENSNNYEISLTILCGLMKITLGSAAANNSSVDKGIVQIPFRGTYEAYTPLKVDVSFYGDTISLNLEDNSIVVGSNDSPLSLDSNELTQFTGREVNITLTNEVIRTSPVMPDVKIYKTYVNSGDLSNLDTIWYNGSVCTVTDINDGYVGVSVYPATTEVGNQLIAMKGKEAFNVYAYKSANNQKFLDRYYGIVKQWENGKETATIRCAIADYYTFEFNALIDIWLLDEQTNECRFTVVDEGDGISTLNVGDVLKPSGGELVVTVADPEQNEYEAIITHNQGLEQEEVGARVYPRAQVSAKREYGVPMTFHIGDIVIPYTFGANGQDKPLSLNKDGTAKEFEVHGKKIIYDGAIWQELYLQEHSTSSTPPY